MLWSSDFIALLRIPFHFLREKMKFLIEYGAKLIVTASSIELMASPERAKYSAKANHRQMVINRVEGMFGKFQEDALAPLNKNNPDC